MATLPASVTSSPHGLPSLAICNPLARARVYLQGAHVAEWRPAAADEALWMSVRSTFEAGKPIRGGVPICFPWFGPHPTRPELPAHGFARTSEWTLLAANDREGGATTVVLGLSASESTRALWPHDFSAEYSVTVGAALELELAVTNRGAAPFAFEEALHTYFGVGDVRRACVTGLAGAQYVDKVDGGARKVQAPDPITFAGETDRLYVGTEATCVIDDASLGRRVRIAKSGSRSTVVWNPWIAKAARMPDFGDHEWPGMVCVETANAADDRVELAPGATHRMRVTLTVER